ncbi:hypothetical protein Golax_006497, partial [Gossypium laxum]|nr:hypothetical protein [Gossypium laxum]
MDSDERQWRKRATGLTQHLVFRIEKARNELVFGGSNDNPIELPKEGCLKINCDASMVKDNPIAGIAMACRDSNGQIINGSNRQLCVGPIEVAEAMAFKDTCSIISHKNWPQVFIESDFKVVVDQIFAS